MTIHTAWKTIHTKRCRSCYRMGSDLYQCDKPDGHVDDHRWNDPNNIYAVRWSNAIIIDQKVGKLISRGW